MLHRLEWVVPVRRHRIDRLEEEMAFVFHSMWLEPMVAGCNVGECVLVTSEGIENLSCHTPIEPHRVSV